MTDVNEAIDVARYAVALERKVELLEHIISLKDEKIAVLIEKNDMLIQALETVGVIEFSHYKSTEGGSPS